MHSIFKICISRNMKCDKTVGFLKYSHIWELCRLVGIMLQILIIILFRISSKKLSKCFCYSQVSLIMLKKHIPNYFDLRIPINFFKEINQIFRNFSHDFMLNYYTTIQEIKQKRNLKSSHPTNRKCLLKNFNKTELKF